MKKGISFIFHLIVLVLSAFAQDSTTTKPHKLSIGLEAAIYKGGFLGLDIRCWTPKEHQYVLKINRFNVHSEGFSANSAFQSYVEPDYDYQGTSVKLGYAHQLDKTKKGIYIHWSLLGIATHAQHQLKINYYDVLGLSTETYTKNLVTLGFETDCNISLVIAKKIIVSTRITYGYKQRHFQLFNEVVNEFPTYFNYTPSQGYSKHHLYINAGISVGVFL